MNVAMGLPLLKWFKPTDETDREPGERHAFHSDVRQLRATSTAPEFVLRADVCTAARLLGLGDRDLNKIDPAGRDPELPLDVSCLVGECLAQAQRRTAEAKVLLSTIPPNNVAGRPPLPSHRLAHQRADVALGAARAWTALSTILSRNTWLH